jgi:methionyl aminopeptidase
LHEEPVGNRHLAGPSHEKRLMKEGQVFTVEPFLSLGATVAESDG